MPYSQHPLLAGLRAVREPKGRTKEVIDALCKRQPRLAGRRLPSDAEIAQRLGMTVRTVRQHIWTFANWIEGLEELSPRERIYIWYWHREWEQSLEPAAAAR